VLESLCGIITDLFKENQELKDEVNRLKGEKGKPKLKQNKDASADTQKNKEKMESGSKKKKTKGSKNDKIKIDRAETIKLDKTNLPDDIEFKGYEEKIVQNIIIKTDNVLYRLEKYYSPSLRKTYTAEIDDSLKNTEFGVETKALISTLYYENRVTENKIASFLNANGLLISEGTISNILIKEESKELTRIKNEIFEAGLSSSIYQQIDDTGMRLSNKNAYATIVCNEKYSAFFINTSKNRETIKTFLPPSLSSMFTVLIGDDAPQFKKIAEKYGLCWIHEERHYTKLTPIFEYHRKELDRVRSENWGYYKKLKDYKEAPTEQKKNELWDDFDTIFKQKTYYDELSKRLSLTFEKKNELLTVLDYPEIPLHNNLSENGVREMVKKRKISGGTKNEDGQKAWENNMSILATCKKLGICFFDFMKGVFAKNTTVNLPELILQ
jgi:RNAse (barnase) inhibitor barstar